MAQTDTGEPIQSTTDIEPVVDCDVHLTERQEDVLPYIDEPFHSMFTRSGHEDYGYMSDVLPNPGFITPVTTGKVQSDSARSIEDLERSMELMNSDHVMITPTRSLYINLIQKAEFAVAYFNAYNDYLLDTYLDDGGPGMHGTVLISTHKPHESAEEIDRRAGEDGIEAVMLPGAGTDPPLGNHRYYPIYEACEDNDLPLMIHNAASGAMKSFPQAHWGYNSYLESHVTNFPMQHMVNLTNMIVQGIPERYPDLDVVLQEAGIGWIPYMMRRLDSEYSSKREDAPMLTQMPSEYIHDQFYFTSQPLEGQGDANYVTAMAELLDIGRNLLFSSDYPHLDFDDADVPLKLLRSKFDDETIRDFYGRTAMTVFDL